MGIRAKREPPSFTLPNIPSFRPEAALLPLERRNPLLYPSRSLIHTAPLAALATPPEPDLD
jgi:hypothetical protein